MSAERLMADLLLADPDDPAVAAEAMELAQRIMALTEASGALWLVVAAALDRCIAGFWARFTLDADCAPEIAAESVLARAEWAAIAAEILARKGLRHPPN